MANNYQDLAIRRQVILERIKSGQFSDIQAAFRQLEKLVREAFAGLEDEFESLSRTRLEKFINQIRDDQIRIFSNAMDAFATNLSKIGQLAAAQESDDLERFIDLRGTKLNGLTKIDLQRNVLKRPLSVNGDLLSSWTKNFTAQETKRVGDVIRLAWSQGETNAQAVRRVIGTKANGYKDGILAISRRNASTVVRTAIQHVASSARMEIWKANPTIVRGYEWLSTLDRKTSRQCKFLDGQKFEMEKGPVPPIHPNCRSTTLPLTNPKYDFLDEGATRSGEFGPVSAKDGYYDWLKRQDRSVVVDALGEKRAKLFLDGGLTPERFRQLQFDRNFEPLTLDEIKAKEPKAWERAFGRDKSQKTTKKLDIQTPQEKRRRVSILGDEILEKENALEKLKKEREGTNDPDRFRELRKSIKKADDELFDARIKAKKDAHKILGIPESEIGSKESMVDRNGIDQEVKDVKIKKPSFQYHGQDFRTPVEKMESALNWISRMVTQKNRPKNVGVRLLWEDENRAYYNHNLRAIFVDEHTSEGTFIHEFIHNIEFENPEISNKTKAFLLKRSGGKQAEKLRDLTGNTSYGADEIAFEDEWVKRGGSVYTGKLYPDEATEVLTMGVQRIFENPIQFAKDDPEFFEFVLSTLQN